MKVLMLSELPESHMGGVEKYTENLLINMPEIHFFVSPPPKKDKSCNTNNIPLCQRLLGVSQIMYNIYTYTKRIWYLFAILNRFKPELVHIQYSNFFDLFLLLLPRFLRFKVIFTMHVSNLWKHMKNNVLHQISIFLFL